MKDVEKIKREKKEFKRVEEFRGKLKRNKTNRKRIATVEWIKGRDRGRSKLPKNRLIRVVTLNGDNF